MLKLTLAGCDCVMKLIFQLIALWSVTRLPSFVLKLNPGAAPLRAWRRVAFPRARLMKRNSRRFGQMIPVITVVVSRGTCQKKLSMKGCSTPQTVPVNHLKGQIKTQIRQSFILLIAVTPFLWRQSAGRRRLIVRGLRRLNRRVTRVRVTRRLFRWVIRSMKLLVGWQRWRSG